VTTDAPRAAYDRVLDGAGATVPARDQADALLVSQVRSQTGILIQSEQDLVTQGVGDSGYGTLTQATRAPDFDTDRDGMPNAFESSNGFNPNDAADRNGDGGRRRLHESRRVLELARTVVASATTGWRFVVARSSAQGLPEHDHGIE
jgi:hypothetical protein